MAIKLLFYCKLSGKIHLKCFLFSIREHYSAQKVQYDPFSSAIL